MRFDMAEASAVGGAEGLKCPDLVGKVITDFIEAAIHIPAAKTEKIGKSRVRTDPDPVVMGELDGPVHYLRVAGMKTAGNVGRGDSRNDVSIHSQGVCPEAFAHVAVEVNDHPVITLTT
jgi:hypothetical protein